jgi:uncharacterized protein involved in outer membrane biogenesis
MTAILEGRRRKRTRLWLALALAAAVLAVLIVPPMVSIGRYKSRITQLISTSLGRPVSLSSVELRLLPRPGFVLTDLTVEDDPAYGTEPVLHANTVTASIRLLSLWRGRLELDRISADEASLNLVRMPEGRWNLDSLFRTAASKGPSAASARMRPAMPYLEATNSRINFKDGVEKLPFSLLNTDVTLWQESPGEWRVRLRGQPARTDVSMDLGDTGIVELSASLHQAVELRRMPLNLDVEWREAQLGQLTRLLLGSDAGWRGALTGELHLEGTADAAQIKTQLRAKNVHRAEFAPAAPMDFDANCTLLYHFSSRSFENLACDSPLGDGRVHLTGDMPADGSPRLTVEVDRIPAAAALDALRTVRSNFAPGLEARGQVSGKIVYAEAELLPVPAAEQSGKQHAAKASAAPPEPLTGSLSVDGFELSSGALSEPIRLPRLTFVPSSAQPAPAAKPNTKQPRTQASALSSAGINPQSQPQTLETTFSILAGGPAPLTVNARLGLAGYDLRLTGQASLDRVKEYARAAGLADAGVLDAVAPGADTSAASAKDTAKANAAKPEPVTLDVAAAGPWIAAEKLSLIGVSPAVPLPTAAPAATSESTALPAASPFTATISLRNVSWKSDFLANPVEIAQATLHIGNGEAHWDPVAFEYGPVKGVASLNLPTDCGAPQNCTLRFQLQFGALDAAALQAAILGAQGKETLLSTLLGRLSPSATAPTWPLVEGAIKADSLVLGPVTLRQPTAAVRIQGTDAEIISLDASLLGGQLHGAGSLRTAGSAQAKPAYVLTGQFEKLNPTAIGQLVGQHWSGGDFSGSGKIELTGFTGKDLASSARGTIQFQWMHGSVAGVQIPPALARFDQWTGEAEVANGGLSLKTSQAERRPSKSEVKASATFGIPGKVTYILPEPVRSAKK